MIAVLRARAPSRTVAEAALAALTPGTFAVVHLGPWLRLGAPGAEADAPPAPAEVIDPRWHFDVAILTGPVPEALTGCEIVTPATPAHRFDGEADATP